MRYETASLDDLRTILLDCVIRYKGAPVLIEAVTQGAKGYYLLIRNIATGEDYKVGINSRNLNFLPVRLGYCNTPYGAAYVARRPARAFQQGLSLRNVSIRCLDYEDNYLQRNLYCSYLSDCILGAYPSLNKAIEVAQVTRKSCAFSRVAAISKDGGVLYKEEKVGFVRVDDASICFKWGYEELARVVK